MYAIRAKIQNVIKLTPEGEQYAKKGLPERNLILATAELGGTADLQAAAKKANLAPEFIQIALGWTIRKKWATYTPQNNTLHITESLLHQTTIPEDCDETFLKHLSTKHQVAQEDLSPELQKATEQLKKRKLLTIEPKTTRTLQITVEGSIKKPVQLILTKCSKSSSYRGYHPTYSAGYYYRQMANCKTPKIQHRSACCKNLARKKTSLPAISR